MYQVGEFRPTSAHMRRRTFRALFQCKFTIPRQQFYQLSHDEYTLRKCTHRVRANRTVNRVLSACIGKGLWKCFCASAQMYHEILVVPRRTCAEALSDHLFQCKFTIPVNSVQLSCYKNTFLRVLMHVRANRVNRVLSACIGTRGSENASAQVCRWWDEIRPTSAHMRRRTFRALLQWKFTIPSEQFYQLSYDEYTFLSVLIVCRAKRVHRVLSACIGRWLRKCS